MGDLRATAFFAARVGCIKVCCMHSVKSAGSKIMFVQLRLHAAPFTTRGTRRVTTTRGERGMGVEEVLVKATTLLLCRHRGRICQRFRRMKRILRLCIRLHHVTIVQSSSSEIGRRVPWRHAPQPADVTRFARRRRFHFARVEMHFFVCSMFMGQMGGMGGRPGRGGGGRLFVQFSMRIERRRGFCK